MTAAGSLIGRRGVHNLVSGGPGAPGRDWPSIVGGSRESGPPAARRVGARRPSNSLGGDRLAEHSWA